MEVWKNYVIRNYGDNYNQPEKKTIILHNHKSNKRIKKKGKIIRLRQKVMSNGRERFAPQWSQLNNLTGTQPFTHRLYFTARWGSEAVGRRPGATGSSPGSAEGGTRKIWVKRNFLIGRPKCETHHIQTGDGLLLGTLITCNDTPLGWISLWPLCWRN